MTDPFVRLPVVARLLAAAALCVVPLGLVWSQRPGSLTPGFVGPTSCDADGFCTVGTYTPGTYLPGGAELGSQSPGRLFLLTAVAALLFCATRTRTRATLRVARLACGSVTIGATLAGSELAGSARSAPTVVCLALALGLVGPLVVGRTQRPGR